MSSYDDAETAAAFLRDATPLRPRIGVVLGSGLGAWADTLDDAVRLPYGTIPGFPPSAVEGHAGQLVIGHRSGVAVAAMQGRAHRYEGHSIASVTFPMRAFARMGVETLLLTNAAGGVNPDFGPGTLMLIRDHLNLTGSNPLVGANEARFGPRFPDMTFAWDPACAELARQAAAELGIRLAEGVYAGVLGPSYETPAEVRMIRTLGGDAVGMSTVPEVIVAHHAGLRCLGISCITNAAAGISGEKLDHSEVQDVATLVRDDFLRLVDRIVSLLGTPASA
jgi:purine-nucleoside phosphorylase